MSGFDGVDCWSPTPLRCGRSYDWYTCTVLYLRKQTIVTSLKWNKHANTIVSEAFLKINTYSSYSASLEKVTLDGR